MFPKDQDHKRRYLDISNLMQFMALTLYGSGVLIMIMVEKIWPNWIPPLVIYGSMLVSVVIFGMYLYWFRCNYRILYGWIEVLIGGLTFVWTALEYINTPTVPGQIYYETITLATVLKASAGVYIIVRGFDNVEAGIPPESPNKGRFSK